MDTDIVRGRPLPRVLGERHVDTVQNMAGGGRNIAGTRTRYKKTLGDEQYTHVFITINTNLKTRDPVLRRRQLIAARNITAQMFASREILEVLDVDERRPINLDTRANLLDNIKANVAAEVGRERNSIHTHSTVKLHHTTRVFFNRLKMKAFFFDRMNAISQQYDGIDWMRRPPNIKVKLLADPRQEEKLRKYMNKDAGKYDVLPIEESF